MTRLSFIAATLIGLLAMSASAERAGDQGYGLMLGNPTAVTAKVWLDNVWAIDGAVGFARSEFDLHTTLLFHLSNWRLNRGAIAEKGEFPLYFGAGPRLLFEKKEELGLRFPLGVSFLPHRGPWEIFAEVAPVARLTPSFGFNGDFAVGFRYYFKPIKPKVNR